MTLFLAVITGIFIFGRFLAKGMLELLSYKHDEDKIYLVFAFSKA